MIWDLSCHIVGYRRGCAFNIWERFIRVCGGEYLFNVALEEDGLFNITLEDEETKLSKVDSLDDTLLSLLAKSEISHSNSLTIALSPDEALSILDIWLLISSLLHSRLLRSKLICRSNSLSFTLGKKDELTLELEFKLLLVFLQTSQIKDVLGRGVGNFLGEEEEREEEGTGDFMIVKGATTGSSASLDVFNAIDRVIITALKPPGQCEDGGGQSKRSEKTSEVKRYMQTQLYTVSRKFTISCKDKIKLFLL